ncbi:MAG: Crp/Fnr family transcriptional regulator [Proteobacteria bacterium]|nr:MAG: Crp/Fnr family transcriptional regulator [Pseudomonadota bacterium]
MAQPVITEELGKSMLFRSLSQDQLDRVATRAVRVRVTEGETLFEQQDPADRFYLLVTGQIKLFRLSPDGDEKVIEVITPGATFAEALMFLERPNFPVGAQALRSSEVISIDARDFVSMLRESVDTCLLLAADLSQRLHGLLREINDLSLNTGTCRVAAYFIQNAVDGSDEFALPLAKQVLASRLSIKPETLSRIFRSLTNAGLVSIRGNRVTILDRRHLEDLAQTCAADEISLLSTFHYPRRESGETPL